MANQRAANIIVAALREDTEGVAATTTGADRARIIDSPGLQYKRALAQSQEKRTDGTVQEGRLTGKSVDGSYNFELTVGGLIDSFIEAVMRSSWTAANEIDETDMTSITTTTTTIVGAAGSWITQGVRVGDTVRLTNHSSAANNNINLRVITVTASTLTIAGTAPLTANAVADSAFELTVLKRIVTNTAGPTRYTYSVDQYDVDNDLSELFLGCKVVGMRLSFRPGAMAQVSFTLMGIDRTALATGTSPHFTSPTATTGLALVADDATIFYNGADVATFTGFDIDFQITAGGEPVIASLTTPTVFDNDLATTGSLTGIRQDFANLTLFDAETNFGVGIVLTEPGTAPVGTLSFYLSNVKISELSAPVGGGDGAKIETIALLASVPTATSSLDASVAVICSSAA